jgi:hypothetical protein
LVIFVAIFLKIIFEALLNTLAAASFSDVTQGGIQLLSLSDDLLEKILSCGCSASRMRLREVCIRFNEIIKKDVKALSFNGERMPLQLEFIKKFSSLKKLNFDHTSVKERHLDYITSDLKYESLSFFSCQFITRNLFQKLYPLIASLTSLNLSKTVAIHHGYYKCLSHLTSLTRLELFDTAITGEDFFAITNLPCIKYLDIGACNYLKSPNDTLKHLSTMTILENLLICQMIDLDSRDLFFIQESLNLKCLNLSNCSGVEDLAFNRLQYLTRLDHLILEGCRISRCFEILSFALYLQKLDVSFSFMIDDLSLMNIASMTTLLDLKISGCIAVSSVGVKHLSHLHQLTDLDMRGCTNVTNQGFKTFKVLKNLKKLNIDECELLTDLALYYLSPLKNLNALSMKNILNITSMGLALFKYSNQKTKLIQ